MKPYPMMTKKELQKEKAHVQALICTAREKNLHLDMSRGKPSKEQLNLSMAMMTDLCSVEDCIDDGVDVRNYGLLCGLPSARALFADLLGTKPDCVFVGGNSSLKLMYDLIATAYTHGLKNSSFPWKDAKQLRFLCPAPGYDRHFRITESFGIEMIPIAMTDDGPDMDLVEQWVKDPSVVGIWCCPKFSNPDGIVYSDETIRRIAALKPSARDFVVMWDNAYVMHEFDAAYTPFPDILSIAESYGNRDMVFEFASTSKVTFPGAGISCMASSPANIAYLSKLYGVQTIGYDKINQLRHVRFLKNKEHTLELMRLHAAILKPRFDVVFSALESEIGPLEIAKWKKPKGGYFVSLYAMPGTAKRTLALCKDAGLTMTDAGATFPYGQDPMDSNIRIAPSVPSIEELQQAIAILCLCLRFTALEQLLKLA